MKQRFGNSVIEQSMSSHAEVNKHFANETHQNNNRFWDKFLNNNR